MSTLTRFSVSLDQKLLQAFDGQIAGQGYPTRSKAVADLIARSLVSEEWKTGREVAGVVVLVYDHHKPGLSHKLMHIQHDYHTQVLSSQHVHLDHDHCLEVVIVRGRPAAVRELAQRLQAVKGVKYAKMMAASTGKDL